VSRRFVIGRGVLGRAALASALAAVIGFAAAAAQTTPQPGTDVNAARGDGITALHLAAEQGDVERARALLDAGADVGPGTRIGRYTPLHLAARGGHGAVVTLLLEAGADPLAVTTNSGATALHMAAGAVRGHGAVAVLLEHGADPDAREASAGQTPLMFAAAVNRAEAIAVLLEGGANPGLATDEVDVLRSLALDRESSRRFRERLRQPPETVDPYGPQPATHTTHTDEPGPAIVQAAIRAEREFLRSGHDVGPVDARSLARVGPDYPGGPDVVRPPYRESLVGRTGGMTALLYAAREGHRSTASLLVESGADLNQPTGGDQSTPMLVSVINGNYDLARDLLERGGDPNLVSDDGAGPLFATLNIEWSLRTWYPQPQAFRQQETHYLDFMRLLLDAGADPNQQTTDQRHHQTESGHQRGGAPEASDQPKIGLETRSDQQQRNPEPTDRKQRPRGDLLVREEPLEALRPDTPEDRRTDDDSSSQLPDHRREVDAAHESTEQAGD